MKKFIYSLLLVMIFTLPTYSANWQPCGSLSYIDVSNINYTNNGNLIIWAKMKTDAYTPKYQIMEMQMDYSNNICRVYQVHMFNGEGYPSKDFNLRGMVMKPEPGFPAYDVYNCAKKYKK